MAAALAAPARTLVLGIGGGGDVVGALGFARELEAAGSQIEVGGVAWERFAIDPYPGPRTLEQLTGIEQLGSERAALCGADGRIEGGAGLAEAGVAGHLGRPTVLVDLTAGPAAAAAGIDAAMGALDCERLVLLDVGGDILAAGDEPGLASPLCDAVMLATARRLDDVQTVGCVIGAGCDGELTPAEVLARVAALGRDRAWTGTHSIGPAAAEEMIELAGIVPTEASLQAARCALGEIGETPIRGGRRTVELGPVGAIAFLFDPGAAIGGAAPLAALVADAGSIAEANDALLAAGIRTELEYERERASGGDAARWGPPRA